MEFSLKVASPATEKTGAVIVAATGDKLSPAAQALDQASNGALARALKAAGFEGKPGQSQALFGLPGISAEQVLVIGAGPAAELDTRGLQRAAAVAVRALAQG
ncbi:MAG TPA: M17 family peptidase N-terminal domain-containing protein, partial [Moraxellaceae bacterium]